MKNKSSSTLALSIYAGIYNAVEIGEREEDDSEEFVYSTTLDARV